MNRSRLIASRIQQLLLNPPQGGGRGFERGSERPFGSPLLPVDLHGTATQLVQHVEAGWIVVAHGRGAMLRQAQPFRDPNRNFPA